MCSMYICFLRCGYGSIPIDTFLVGWTSIYQLFWGSLGTRVLTHPHVYIICKSTPVLETVESIKPLQKCDSFEPSLKLPLQPFPPPEHRTFWRIDNYWWTKTWSKYGYIYMIYVYIYMSICMYIYILYVYMYVYIIICIYICACVCVCVCIYGFFYSAYGLDPSFLRILVGCHGFPPNHSLIGLVSWGTSSPETQGFYHEIGWA